MKIVAFPHCEHGRESELCPQCPTEEAIEIDYSKLIWVLGRTKVDHRSRFYYESRVNDGEKRFRRLIERARTS